MKRRSDKATPTKSGQAPRRRGRHARGFTVTELLIVVAMIIVLLSLLIVAVNAANRSSQRANTRFLMNSIKQALVSFKDDVGYYPPVLGTGPNPPAPDEVRNLMEPPDPEHPDYESDVQDWFSRTSLAEYLIGYGEGADDGYGYVDIGESPPLGIRGPSHDGVWGATIYSTADGSFEARSPPLTGAVYGPYLELKDERLLASTDGTTDSDGNLNVFFPGEGGYSEDHPKVIVDYWGRPIRYYRRTYPPGALKASYRPGLVDPVPTLADVTVLRPFYFKVGAELALRSGEFAILSSGPDRVLDVNEWLDDEGFNTDNILEVGP